jgi:hypothetical protein
MINDKKKRRRKRKRKKEEREKKEEEKERDTMERTPYDTNRGPSLVCFFISVHFFPSYNIPTHFKYLGHV